MIEHACNVEAEIRITVQGEGSKREKKKKIGGLQMQREDLLENVERPTMRRQA